MNAKKKSVYAVAPTMEATQFDVLENNKAPKSSGCPLFDANFCGVIAGYSPTVWIKWVQDTLEEQVTGRERETIDRVITEINHAHNVSIKNRLYWRQQKMLRAGMHLQMVGKMTVLNILAEDEFRYEATKLLLEMFGVAGVQKAPASEKATRAKKLA